MTDSISFRKLIDQIKSGYIHDVKRNFKLEYLEMEDEFGRPIHYACHYNSIELVKFLLCHKCSIEVNDYWGMHPVQHACRYGQFEILKLLMEHKCNMETIDYWGMRPLHHASIHGNFEIVKFLLEHKCNVESCDYVEMQPLHYACQYGHFEIVKLLLEHKSNIEAHDYWKMRPIQHACENGHIEIVKLLLAHKCNIKDGYDNLMRTAINKSHDISDLLTAARKNQSMCSIALSMSLKCESGCCHSSCFTTMSVDDLKKASDFIGTGTHGEVYKCSKFERSFALKIIRINDESKNIEENIEEYRNILKHDNIVQYFGAITESRHMIIFMEYMDGESLHDLIKDHGAISHNNIARYSRQILLGMAFLHNKKIIHRDIKPRNILLDSVGKCLKLCDFGLSRSLMTISTITTQNANTGCGTPNYLAPEVIKQEPYSFPVDIWALGATMVEMLTGYPPFHKMHPFNIIIKLNQISTIEFTSVQPMSDSLKSFVKQMLESEPSKRATAKELLESKFIYFTSLNDNFEIK